MYKRQYTDRHSPERVVSVQWQAEKLFYRTAEIRARADKVNDRIEPDLVLCLHLNAEAWGDPEKPEFVDANHLHILVNGAYGPTELVYDDVRFEMLRRLLSGTHREEISLARSIAPALAKTTGLEPYIYTGDNAIAVGDDPYIYARNLLANRLYECPVIYFEPYVMNNSTVYRRLSKGDYIGRTRVGDEMVKSIYREYTQGVIDGLVNYYLQHRKHLDEYGDIIENEEVMEDDPAGDTDTDTEVDAEAGEVAE